MTDSKLNRALPGILQRAENLPTMPDVAVEILRLTENQDDVGLNEFAPVLERDPGLAAKLLRLANSAAYGTGEPVTSLEQATSLLGMQTLQTMALSFCLVDNLSKYQVTEAFQFQRYWQRSMCCAVSARSMARMTKTCSENEAFLCGLLSGLGQLVLSICLPRLYEPVLLRTTSAMPRWDEEERTLGFNHSDVGAALLREWGLPEKIYTCVGDMHRPQLLPESADQGLRDLVSHTRMAFLTTEVLDGENRADSWIALAALAREQGIEPKQLAAYIVALETDLAETAQMMDMNFAGGQSHVEVLAAVREDIVRLSAENGRIWNATSRREAPVAAPLRRPERASAMDPLTTLSPRSHLDEVMDEELALMQSGTRLQSLGVLRIELQNTKPFTAANGKDALTGVLRGFGRHLARTCRRSDLPAFCGGTTFAVLSSRTSPSGLEGLAERLLAALSAEQGGLGIQVTAVMGGACVARCEAGAGAMQLWRTAGEALERARLTGSACEVNKELRLRAA